MIHRVSINLLEVKSAEKVFFNLSDLFKITPFVNRKIFLLSSYKEYTGCIFMMNIVLDNNCIDAISEAINSMGINHFGYSITDMTNDNIYFGHSNIVEY